MDKISFINIIKQFFVGKTILVKNAYSRYEKLKIEDVKISHHSVEITPSTPQNDWWGETKDWDMIEITFENGYKKEFSFGDTLEVIND